MTFPIHDIGGRRLGIERRQTYYDVHVPERRIGRDRRSGIDRRHSSSDFRSSERRKCFKEDDS